MGDDSEGDEFQNKIVDMLHLRFVTTALVGAALGVLFSWAILGERIDDLEMTVRLMKIRLDMIEKYGPD